jgi:hypothetical protein
MSSLAPNLYYGEDEDVCRLTPDIPVFLGAFLCLI